MGATLLGAVGMPELLCRDFGDYEDRTVHLANTPGDLKAIRTRLAEQFDSAALFDVDRYANGLDRACRLMWENYLEGADSRNIVVPALSDDE